MMNIFRKILNWLFKKETPMAAIDYSGLSALVDVLVADVQKIAAELAGATAVQAAFDVEKAAHAADKALLDQANADLASSQAAVADLQAKLQAPIDALGALLLPASAPTAPVGDTPAQ